MLRIAVFSLIACMAGLALAQTPATENITVTGTHNK
jgi:hypothetical protein